MFIQYFCIDAEPAAELSTSRSVLWLYKCQYVHSAKQSMKFVCAGENLFINACTLKVKLTDFVQREAADEHVRTSTFGMQLTV